MRSDSFNSDLDVMEDMEGYRAFDWMSTLALLLTFVGALALFHPAFVLFPMVALGLILFSFLQTIREPKVTPKGRLRWISLALAIFWASFPVALHYFNGQRELNAAKVNVEHWMKLLRGENPQAAYLLTLGHTFRPTKTDSVARTLPLSTHASLAIDDEGAFLNQPTNKILADPNNTLRFRKLTQRFKIGPRVDYGLQYDLHLGSPVDKTIQAVFELVKTSDPNGIDYWQLTRCQLIDQ
jgi:hypothetical protein